MIRRKPTLALVTAAPRPTKLADRLSQRAYRHIYRPGVVNACPGCGKSHWYVGRSNAECAFCEAILPIAGEGEPLTIVQGDVA